MTARPQTGPCPTCEPNRLLKQRFEWNRIPSCDAFLKAGLACSVGRFAFFLCGQKLWQPDEVIGGEVEDELAAYAFETAQHSLGDWPDGLASSRTPLRSFCEYAD